MRQAYLENLELVLDSSLVGVHEGRQLGQADGRVQLQELLQHWHLPLLVHKACEGPPLLPATAQLVSLKCNSIASQPFMQQGLFAVLQLWQVPLLVHKDCESPQLLPATA